MALRAEPPEVDETTARVQRVLQRLPHDGVFDFLAFSADRGTVTVVGYDYRGSLKADVATAVKRVAGVDDVGNKIEQLPASQRDDRIRWATLYDIYTDDFPSRYAPGGQMRARYEALSIARYPGMQPFGMYPIHIVVKKGRATLLGVVGNEVDRRLAEVRAREVPGVFAVENELVIDED
jgi:hyperosmotically inducible periplasmic protein